MVATADKNVRAGGVGGGGRCKVGADSSKLGDTSKSAHGVLEGPLVTKTGLSVKTDVSHSSLDVTGEMELTRISNWPSSAAMDLTR